MGRARRAGGPPRAGAVGGRWLAPEDAAKEKPGMESPPPWSLSLLLRPAVAVPVLSARLRLPNPICAAL